MEGFGDRAPYGGVYGRDQPRGEGFGDQQRPYYEEDHEGQVGEFAGERGKYATPQETYEYGKSRDQAELGAGGGGQGAGQAAYGGSQKMGDEDVYGDEDIEDDDDIDEDEKERRKIKRRERAAKAVAAGAAGYALYERHKVKNLDKDADEREEEEEERRQSEDSGGRKHHWF